MAKGFVGPKVILPLPSRRSESDRSLSVRRFSDLTRRLNKSLLMIRSFAKARRDFD
ncbi:MAG TPA: hypothetical protein VMV10_07315 [Pirellulales bacterium]|nr:hypothetical protein [Pirellulales bacterium]